jgi:protein-S-isoprenylcysteine O-methyltransferase Ste14
MYLGMALAYVGCVMLVNSVWCVLFLPVVLTLAYVLAIRPEERYLTSKFGEPYRRYCADVRRWI